MWHRFGLKVISLSTGSAGDRPLTKYQQRTLTRCLHHVGLTQVFISELFHLLQRRAENHVVILKLKVSYKLLLLQHHGEPQDVIGPHLAKRDLVPTKPLRPHFWWKHKVTMSSRLRGRAICCNTTRLFFTLPFPHTRPCKEIYIYIYSDSFMFIHV